MKQTKNLVLHVLKKIQSNSLNFNVVTEWPRLWVIQSNIHQFPGVACGQLRDRNSALSSFELLVIHHS